MNTIQLIQSILVGGTATAFATQLLKSEVISFIPSERYPRLTAFVVSVIASLVAVTQAGFDASAVREWTDWLALVCGTLLVSSVTYNQLIKGADPQKSL